MGASVYNPVSDPLWESALVHLEEDNPNRLRYLWSRGDSFLKSHLGDLVEKGNRLAGDLEEKGVDPDEAMEFALNRIVAPPNELGRDQPPLTPSEQARLTAFRRAALAS